MSDISQQPLASPGMVIFSDKNANHDDENLPVEDNRRKWTYWLFNCCFAPKTCLTAFLCPCVIYGRNLKRYRHMEEHGSPDPDPKGGFINSDCATHACLACCCCGYVLRMGTRRNIRNRYNIDGDAGRDCCTACCCGSCELTQEARELEREERRYYREQGREHPNTEEQNLELPAVSARFQNAIPSWATSRLQESTEVQNKERQQAEQQSTTAGGSLRRPGPQPLAVPASVPSSATSDAQESHGSGEGEIQQGGEQPNKEQDSKPEPQASAISARFKSAMPSWAASRVQK